jgi:aliphatic nitrilase
MADEYPKVRVAAVQAAPVWLDREATTEKAVAFIEQAADGGAGLVTFSEGWLPGYPWWIWLGSPAWGVPFFLALHANSVEVPSETTAKLCNAAKQYNVQVVMGMSERDGGSLYCTQLFIDEEGEIIGKRRKLKPTHVERTVWGEGDGSDLMVLDTPHGKVGGLNCWEHVQPLNRYAMYSLGEQIHVGSWPAFCLYTQLAPALGAEANAAASRTYALEGQTFVVHTSGLVSSEMRERLADTEERQALLEEGGGHTEIFGPDGSTLAGPLAPNEEGILFADLDLSLIPLAKMVGDPTGHYSRPDVTQLLFDRRPKPAVEGPLPSGGLDRPPTGAERYARADGAGTSAEHEAAATGLEGR